MGDLLTALSRAVEGAPAVAILASFAWGALSVVLSPCHLASIPLIVGFVDAQGRTSTKRAFIISALFSVGILITIAAIGAITAAAGRMAGDLGRVGNYAVAVVFFVVGLHFLGVIPMPWSGPGQVGWKRKGGPIATLALVQEASARAQAHPRAKLEWIKAHDGSRWNEYADSLATTYRR